MRDPASRSRIATQPLSQHVFKSSIATLAKVLILCANGFTRRSLCLKCSGRGADFRCRDEQFKILTMTRQAHPFDILPHPLTYIHARWGSSIFTEDHLSPGTPVHELARSDPVFNVGQDPIQKREVSVTTIATACRA